MFGIPSQDACTKTFKPLYEGFEYKLNKEMIQDETSQFDNEDDLERCAIRLEQHLDSKINDLEKTSATLTDLDKNIKYEHYKLGYYIKHIEDKNKEI